ncbi:MAG: YqcC family protein [Alphaproteobacteria bacterium]
MTPEQRLAAIMAKLDEVEAELGSIGYWSDGPAPETTGTFLVVPSEPWLQFVFLPKARAWLDDGAPPKRSQFGLMALRQYDFHTTVDEALGRVRLLSQFDELAETEPTR